MLKANEKVFETSLDQLNICDSVLRNGIDSVSDVRKQLSEQSGLEEEIARLGRIFEDMEQTELRLKSTIKILNFAELQYRSCEKNVISNSEVVKNIENGKYRLKPIEIKIPYAEKIDWKKG